MDKNTNKITTYELLTIYNLEDTRMIDLAKIELKHFLINNKKQ